MTAPIPEPGARTGRCQCGDITYTASGTPDDPHLCSCKHCTRVSGGPAMAWVGFPREALLWKGGEPSWFATWPTLQRGFCPRCGTQLFSVAEDAPMIMVTCFSLDDQTGLAPLGHSYRNEAPSWMAITLALEPQPQ